MVALPVLSESERAGLPPATHAYIAALEEAVAALSARVAVLEARLGQNSTNSSRPPSSDPPGRPAAGVQRSGRRPGGQPGHPGQFRALVAADQVTTVLACVPAWCAGCGAALPAAAGMADPADERRQVTEVPVMVAQVTEYRLAARRCAGCGHVTRAEPPAAVGCSRIGPRLTAVTALLTGRYRLSKREAAACVGDLFGVAMATGSVSALEAATSRALAPMVEEARSAVQQAAVANLDETGWRQARQRAWLWTVVTATLTVFHVNRRRAGEVARTLLGPAWVGVVGSDRGTMYAWLPVAQRQICWAHLKRDFQKLVDWGPGARPIGEQLLGITTAVFALWHRYRRGEIDRACLGRDLLPLQTALWHALEAGRVGPDANASAVCWELEKLWPALWTFATVAGVEPTNNAAERALRPAVLWRKGSFGTHSDAGSRFVERLLTVTATCRQQRRPLLDLLTTAIIAARTDAPPPSLIPATG